MSTICEVDGSVINASRSVKSSVLQLSKLFKMGPLCSVDLIAHSVSPDSLRLDFSGSGLMLCS